jgi:hypothetical protein
MKILKSNYAWLLVIIPVITFFGLFFKYTVDAPINDDYGAILGFMNSYLNSATWSEKFTLLFSNLNEHKIVYDRVWTLIVYKVLGRVDLNVLAFIGNLAFVAIAALFYKKFTALGKPIILFLPFTVLLFNLAFWENMTFAMAVLSNITVLVFVMLCLWFITLPTLQYKHVALSVLFYAAAIFSQGGGLFLLPVTVLVFVYRKEYKKLLAYLIPVGLLTLYYLHDYVKHPQSASITDVFLQYKVRLVLFVFSFLGNAFNYSLTFTNNAQESAQVACLAGVLLVGLFIYITKTKYYKKNLFIYSLMVVLLVSAFVTGVSRMSHGLEISGVSRYRINGALFTVCIYFWFIETYTINNKKLWAILITTCFYFGCISIIHYESLSIRQRDTLTGILFYNDGNPNMLSGDRGEDYTKAKVAIFNDAKRLNIYTPPSNKSIEYYFPYSKPVKMLKVTNSPYSFGPSMDSIKKMSDAYLIEGWGSLDTQNTSNQKLYIGVKNQNDSLPVFYTAKQAQRFDLNPYFHKSNLQDAGYIARIKDSYIKPGENTLWMMIEVNGEVSIAQTDKKIIK